MHIPEVPAGYEFDKETYRNHTHPEYIVVDEKWGTSATKQYNPDIHGSVHGKYADIQKNYIDYSYHPSYQPERQITISVSLCCIHAAVRA